MITRIPRSTLTPNHHHRQTSSTQVSPISASINRRIEFSTVTNHHNHQDEDFAGTVTDNLGPASIVFRRRHHQSEPTKLDRTKRREIDETLKIKQRELTEGEARHGAPSPPVILTDKGGAKRSLHLAGT